MPHMTLVMGCVEEIGLGKIERIMGSFIEAMAILDLEIYGVDTEKIRGDITVSSLGIQKIDEIQKLHENVGNELKGFFSGGASREMFYNPPGVSMEEFSYIDKFFEVAGGEKFYPHITIGLGEMQDRSVKFPIMFRAEKIAICHLGDYYTCRKVLWYKNLR